MIFNILLIQTEKRYTDLSFSSLSEIKDGIYNFWGEGKGVSPGLEYFLKLISETAMVRKVRGKATIGSKDNMKIITEGS